MNQFTNAEAAEIVSHALKLMKSGYFSGINRVHFPFENNEKKAYFIFHYMQDSIEQINFVKFHLPKEIKSAEQVTRETYYLFDPEYASKLNFLKEYEKADFRRITLEKITIEDVVRNPEEVIVANKELDFIIAIEDDKENIIELAKIIYERDKEGPEKWIHPAMILRSEKKIQTIPNFRHKMFVAIRKNEDLFYAVIFDKKRFLAMKKYIAEECKNIQKIPDIDINFGMLIYNPCQINKEFDKFMKENLYEFRPLRP